MHKSFLLLSRRLRLVKQTIYPPCEAGLISGGAGSDWLRLDIRVTKNVMRTRRSGIRLKQALNFPITSFFEQTVGQVCFAHSSVHVWCPNQLRSIWDNSSVTLKSSNVQSRLTLELPQTNHSLGSN